MERQPEGIEHRSRDHDVGFGVVAVRRRRIAFDADHADHFGGDVHVRCIALIRLDADHARAGDAPQRVDLDALGRPVIVAVACRGGRVVGCRRRPVRIAMSIEIRGRRRKERRVGRHADHRRHDPVGMRRSMPRGGCAARVHAPRRFGVFRACERQGAGCGDSSATATMHAVSGVDCGCFSVVRSDQTNHRVVGPVPCPSLLLHTGRISCM
jgi:hypothetical protein